MNDGYFDKDGKAITAAEWGRLFRDFEYKRIAYDEQGEAGVSTIWLGLNHNWGEGAPLIFETMVFGGEHNEDQWRYETLDQAIAGHKKACKIAFKKGKK